MEHSFSIIKYDKINAFFTADPQDDLFCFMSREAKYMYLIILISK